jgi:hypothetical protein
MTLAETGDASRDRFPHKRNVKMERERVVSDNIFDREYIYILTKILYEI